MPYFLKCFRVIPEKKLLERDLLYTAFLSMENVIRGVLTVALVGYTPMLCVVQVETVYLYAHLLQAATPFTVIILRFTPFSRNNSVLRL